MKRLASLTRLIRLLALSAIVVLPACRPQGELEVSHSWVREHMIPMAPQAMGIELGDSVRVLAFGEFCHGSRETVQAFESLVSNLSTELGFDILLLEGSVSFARGVDAYVCQNDTSVLKSLDEFIPREEMKRLLLKLRTSPRRFRSFPFDPADPEREASSQFAKLLSDCDSAYYRDLPNFLSRPLNAHVAYVKSNLERYLGQYGADTVLQLELLGNIAVQVDHLAVLARGKNAFNRFRDSCMAANVQLICRRFPERRCLLWAHDLHVWKREGWMGAYLNETLGLAYYVIGTFANRGTCLYFDQGGKITRTLLPAPLPGSIESMITETGLIQISRSGVTQMIPCWYVNSTIQGDYSSPARQSEFQLGKDFNALFLFDSVSAAR